MSIFPILLSMFLFIFLFIYFIFSRLSYADPNSKKEYWFNHITNEGQFDMPESVKKKQEKDQKLINSHSKPNFLVKNEYKSQVIIFRYFD